MKLCRRCWTNRYKDYPVERLQRVFELCDECATVNWVAQVQTLDPAEDRPPTKVTVWADGRALQSTAESVAEIIADRKATVLMPDANGEGVFVVKTSEESVPVEGDLNFIIIGRA